MTPEERKNLPKKRVNLVGPWKHEKKNESEEARETPTRT